MKSFTYRFLLCFFITALSSVQLFSSDPVGISLDKSIFLAISNSPDLKISKADLKIRNRAFVYEAAKFLPDLSVGFTNDNMIVQGNADRRNIELSLGAECLVFDGGKIIIDYVQRKFELEFSKRDILLLTQQIIHKTRRRFFSILVLEEKEKLMDELLDIAQKQLEIAEFEYSNGMISQLDYYDIHLRISQIKVDVQKVKLEKENALIEFKHLIGMGEYTIFLDKEFSYELLDLIREDTAYLQKVAESNRIDLAQSTYSVYRSRVNVANSVLSFLPEVRAGVNLTLSDENFPPRDKQWSFYVDVTLPLAYLPVSGKTNLGGNGGNRKKNSGSGGSASPGKNITYENDIAQARLDMIQRTVNHHQMLITLRMEIKKLVEEYIEIKKMYDIKRMQNDYGKKKLDIMRYKVETGDMNRAALLNEEQSYRNGLLDAKSLLGSLIDIESRLQEKMGVNAVEIKTLLSKRIDANSIYMGSDSRQPEGQEDKDQELVEDAPGYKETLKELEHYLQDDTNDVFEEESPAEEETGGDSEIPGAADSAENEDTEEAPEYFSPLTGDEYQEEDDEEELDFSIIDS